MTSLDTVRQAWQHLTTPRDAAWIDVIDGDFAFHRALLDAAANPRLARARFWETAVAQTADPPACTRTPRRTGTDRCGACDSTPTSPKRKTER
ncbi:hypothetical protein [Streptomyces sioyaensis]